MKRFMYITRYVLVVLNFLCTFLLYYKTWWQHYKNCMCSLRNICDYQESVTTGQKDGRTDRRRTKWSLCVVMLHTQKLLQCWYRIEKKNQLDSRCILALISYRTVFSLFVGEMNMILIKLACSKATGHYTRIISGEQIMSQVIAVHCSLST